MRTSSGERRPRSRAGIVLLSGALALYGCGRPVKDIVMSGLDCGANSTASRTITFNGLLSGDSVLFGHLTSKDDGVAGDARATLNSNGQISVEDIERAKQDEHEVKTTVTGGVTTVLVEDEAYAISATPTPDQQFYDVRIQASCVPKEE